MRDDIPGYDLGNFCFGGYDHTDRTMQPSKGPDLARHAVDVSTAPTRHELGGNTGAANLVNPHGEMKRAPSASAYEPSLLALKVPNPFPVFRGRAWTQGLANRSFIVYRQLLAGDTHGRICWGMDPSRVFQAVLNRLSDKKASEEPPENCGTAFGAKRRPHG
ncbi:predicted protein [Coccidioides posadasii str. Silveira]|uniref:Predicted protein n=2 Tax=Coccidioides posadasii TaxID=199306 RepID=E9DJE1_COCPS|nr:predicted protein [Coccidioides posadasii str. Silveira]KMM64728.1 hypothetical protein CPAG_01080 [Coccidioides posadasii RMSCC 3488]